MKDFGYRLIRPLLFCLDPETAHSTACAALRYLPTREYISRTPITIMGLTFSNRVGLAAGFDKNADYISGIAKLGFGFIEVGTVTPKPQVGNPKPRLFRIPEANALVNHMGFNNLGVEHCVEQLKKRNFNGILGVNIGKNAATPLEKALDDYRYCMDRVYPYAEYITVNVSSPNTAQLRELQQRDALMNLLKPLKQRQAELVQSTGRYVPLLVKIAPDLEANAIQDICDVLNEVRIDGLIATNTATEKSAVAHLRFGQEAGSLSGAPLCNKATAIIAACRARLADDIPIIGVGGIMSGADAAAKIAAGASLVQIYTGLIYQGPGLVGEIFHALENDH